MLSINIAAASCILLLHCFTVPAALPLPHRPSAPSKIQAAQPRATTSGRALTHSRSNGCLRRFHTHPQEYSACKDNVCFLFLQEPPFIDLDPFMTDDRHTEVFPCNAPRSKYKFLSGTAFDIMEKTHARNALCVWGGKDCFFNTAIDFIAEQSANNRAYKFAFTGLLQENSGRLSDSLSQSVSITKEHLAIFGPKVREGNPFPLWRLMRPFRGSAWVLWASMVAIYVLLFAFTYVAFGRRPLSLESLLGFVIGGSPSRSKSANASSPIQSIDTMPGDKDGKGILSSNGSRRRFAMRLLQMARGTMIIVFLAFYEIAVVNFLFIQMSAPIVQDLSNLSKEELRHYSVEKNSATEDQFIRKVCGGEREACQKYGPKLLWYRCDNEQECFDRALNKTADVKYVATFRTTGAYNVLQRNACNNMTLYSTKNEPFTYGAGWVYGGTVPPSYTRKVDRDISAALENGEIQNLIESDIESIGSSECSPKIKSIDDNIIGMSILILVVPFLVVISIIILRFGYLVRQGFASELKKRQYRSMGTIEEPQKVFSLRRREMKRTRDRDICLQKIVNLPIHRTHTVQENEDLERSLATIYRLYRKAKE